MTATLSNPSEVSRSEVAKQQVSCAQGWESYTPAAPLPSAPVTSTKRLPEGENDLRLAYIADHVMS